MDPNRLARKREAVERALQAFGRVIVAFSGGVDSTVLAKLARGTLGKANVLAVTADSASLAREDLAQAKRLAQELDLEHVVIATREVERPAYRANSEARCFVCKQELFEELEDLAVSRHIPVVLYGAIGDDRIEERPGQRAALQYGVRAPLQDAGLEKWEVRELARSLGLSNWDRPQNSCLSSRIPHGQAVTEEKLRQIEGAEAVLRSAGFRQVRVRHLGRRARIEVAPSDMGRFEDAGFRREIAAKLLALGFDVVSVDRAGYRSGGADVQLVDEWVLHSGEPVKEVSTCAE